MTRILALPLLGALSSFYLVVVLRTAWLCDDAYITLRVVDNLLHGRGLVWNVGERVQAYTHPLWMAALAIARLLTGEEYYSSIALSALLSTLAVVIYAWQLRDRPQVLAFGVAALISSRAFVDYSTSGLENPLAYLLVSSLLIGIRLGKPVSERSVRTTAVSLTAGLLLLTRMDLVLLIAPVLAAFLWNESRHRPGPWLMWAVPLLAWETFSLAYYGFPLPNTAYAKLANSIPERELLAQGLFYLRNGTRTDPVTLAVIITAAAVGLTQRRRFDVPIACGTLAYVAYVVWIGGDFMSGRFLAVPFFAGVWQLTLPHRLPDERRVPIVGAALAIVVAATGPYSPPYVSGRAYGAGDRLFDASMEDHGINDERRFYFQYTGLRRRSPGPRIDHPWAADGDEARRRGDRVIVRGNIGFFGYFAGPDVTIIDYYALADPLLARLPARPRWRIGHFARIMPQGYPETVETGMNRLVDPDLSRLYDEIKVITRGPLWRLRRFRAIERDLAGANRASAQAYQTRLDRAGFR